MSHHSGNYGGGYKSPLTMRDKVYLLAALIVVCLVFFVVGGFYWGSFR